MASPRPVPNERAHEHADDRAPSPEFAVLAVSLAALFGGALLALLYLVSR